MLRLYVAFHLVQALIPLISLLHDCSPATMPDSQRNEGGGGVRLYYLIVSLPVESGPPPWLVE